MFCAHKLPFFSWHNSAVCAHTRVLSPHKLVGQFYGPKLVVGFDYAKILSCEHKIFIYTHITVIWTHKMPIWGHKIPICESKMLNWTHKNILFWKDKMLIFGHKIQMLTHKMLICTHKTLQVLAATIRKQKEPKYK